MQVKCFKKILSFNEAIEIAKGGGNIVGKLIFGKKNIEMRLIYIENKYIIYNIEYTQNILSRLLKRDLFNKQKIRVLVDGTVASASYVPDEIETDLLELDSSEIQPTDFGNEILINKGKDMCRRMIRRQMGNYVKLEVESIESVYRPFYIAFYGNLIEGKKVRYLPIPADGNQIRRTF